MLASERNQTMGGKGGKGGNLESLGYRSLSDDGAKGRKGPERVGNSFWPLYGGTQIFLEGPSGTANPLAGIAEIRKTYRGMSAGKYGNLFPGLCSGGKAFLPPNGTCPDRVDDALIPRLERELRAGADAGRPACGHRLELGVEAHAFQPPKEW